MLREGDSGHVGVVRVMNTSATRMSVFVGAADAANIHKWLLSEQANCDVGDEGLRDWYRKYFRKYLRGRLMDHISGQCLFEEFNPAAYNILQVFTFKSPELRETVETSLRDGKENLDIVHHVIPEVEEEEAEQVIEFLKVVDVNKCHTFACPHDEPTNG